MQSNNSPTIPPLSEVLLNLYRHNQETLNQDICDDWEEDEEELDEEYVRYVQAKRAGRAKHAANYAKQQRRAKARELR